MKLEIIKTEKLTDDPWYELYINNQYIMGSYMLDKTMAVYDAFKNNPNLQKETKTILKSEEINVNL